MGNLKMYVQKYVSALRFLFQLLMFKRGSLRVVREHHHSFWSHLILNPLLAGKISCRHPLKNVDQRVFSASIICILLD